MEELLQMYQAMGISPKVYEYGEKALERLQDRFAAIDKIAEHNQAKVLWAMQKNKAWIDKIRQKGSKLQEKLANLHEQLAKASSDYEDLAEYAQKLNEFGAMLKGLDNLSVSYDDCMRRAYNKVWNGKWSDGQFIFDAGETNQILDMYLDDYSAKLMELINYLTGEVAGNAIDDHLVEPLIEEITGLAHDFTENILEGNELKDDLQKMKEIDEKGVKEAKEIEKAEEEQKQAEEQIQAVIKEAEQVAQRPKRKRRRWKPCWHKWNSAACMTVQRCVLPIATTAVVHWS